jgi:hypothetical protein
MIAKAQRLPAWFMAFGTAALACGCSGAPGATGGMGGASDGKYHPAESGTPMQEAEACNTLSTAAGTDQMNLGCVSTSQGCPDLLRVEFMTPCLQYDEGTVQGCVAYYAMATTCGQLTNAIASCVIAPIAGSAPKGCP